MAGPLIQTPPTGSTPAGRAPWTQLLVLLLVCVACLAPFAGKAFHVDDPLFLWTARHVREHPFDFYGFQVNWYEVPEPMWTVTKNPPLACYYLALVGGAFGWGEVPLHLAFLVWPVGVAWGTYRLAERMCTRPLLAGLAAVLTPVFLVSGTSVMCDLMMLCLWVWAVLLWVRGIDHDRGMLLWLSALLIGLSALTKYFGVSLIPLLIVYAVARGRRFGRWLWPLLLPVLILLAYQLWTYKLYGRGLLLDAASFARYTRSRADHAAAAQLLVGLIFLGGCVITALSYVPLVWSRRVVVVGAAVTAGLIALAAHARAVGSHGLEDSAGLLWPTAVQAGLFGAAGLAVLALAVADLWVRRDGGSLLLFLWVAGTFTFTACVNWTINGRSLLPVVPAFGILLMRRLDDRRGPARAGEWLAVGWPLVPAAVVALAVTSTDYRWANSARTAAEHMQATDRPAGGRLWFQGHWGFQYYMERGGARAWDVRLRGLPPGDVVVVPRNNWPVPGVATDSARGRWVPVDTIRLRPCPWLALQDRAVRAGFYVEQGFGPLPYAFGAVPREEYTAFRFGLAPGP
jgi:4-amino-4-deoxy-L-arabinose transferase-like glycosyltransferase